MVRLVGYILESIYFLIICSEKCNNCMKIKIGIGKCKV